MNKIASLYNEWQSLQPISQDVQNRIEQKFMLEFNYNSNHIEGNTLTYGQTELLLMFGKIDGDAKMHDLEEMKAHNVCLKIIQEEAKINDRPLTEYFIRELHRTLLREDYEVKKQLPDGNITTYTVHAGQYKTRPNSVITATGERFEYASPEETPALMTDLVDWYNVAVKDGNLSAIELAALFHYRYIRIHPFEDGNGRIARLLVNFILLRAGFPMIIVRTDDKDSYLNALNYSDIKVGLVPSDGANAWLEDIQPFVLYMKGCLERALELRIKAAKGESIEEKDDLKKKLILLEKEAKVKRGNVKRKSADEVTKIANEFMIPFADKISESMSLFTKFYDICLIETRHITGLGGYERVTFSIFKDTMRVNPLSYKDIYFAIYLKKPTILLESDSYQEQLVYFHFNDEEYIVTLQGKTYEYRYGDIPNTDQIDSWVNEILNQLYIELQDKVRK